MSVQSSSPVACTHEQEAVESEFYLPRNFSYSEDSYLDSYSVSGNFVWNPSREINLCNNEIFMDVIHSKPMDLATECDCTPPVKTGVCCSPAVVADDSTADQNGRERTCSNDSSEEGIYVNSMDDLDSVTSSNGRSTASDEFFVDSINSPEENNLEESSEGHGASIGEAVSTVMNSFAIDVPVLKEKVGKNVKSDLQPASSLPTLRLNVNDRPFIDNDIRKGSSQGSLFDYLAASDSPDDEEDEFSFNRATLRKSSSLKTNKTPPGTPRRKKMVRFADAMGLDLEDVRHVLNADAPPRIPPSAMKDLQAGLEVDRKNIGHRYLTVCFQQPGACEDFLKRVLTRKICLENAVVTNLTITGIIRVANLGFHKFCRVRYTTNGWVTFHDIAASYVKNSCDGPTDRFSFSIVAPADFGLHARLEFALSYRVNDAEYWDNNQDLNYVFECFAKTTPTEAEDSWECQEKGD
ncbi:glycogen-binding subunit 76A-like [Mizuhopecten yessoensis]|uniref:Glycogen-binding subunit 76A n=1 Tax=Mizuhopecten yessoensis TaxID=6573 RepID=A0A210QXT7_MIZYE|nr:glycogen-binding subunit 76A-like [Mizuhopecten yessoensis]XP_021347079.1 glycogen-binding subunit 76A-like [Mizuhopecten yessoensis]OWF53550.1 Glycogen-binding subunit 76A [Mizuhopecten yessoensis]